MRNKYIMETYLSRDQERCSQPHKYRQNLILDIYLYKEQDKLKEVRNMIKPTEKVEKCTWDGAGEVMIMELP